MGVINDINKKFIYLFSFQNKEGRIDNIKTFYGQNWSEVKSDNKTINSVFAKVDNGDGIVQAEELNVLTKIFNYIDKLFNKDEILDAKEINKFQEQLDSGEITLDEIINKKTEEPKKAWSEGLDRNITTIQVSKGLFKSDVPNELKKIGEEQGFTVEKIEPQDDIWIEDIAVRRADGKMAVSYYSSPKESVELMYNQYKSERGNINIGFQGRPLHNGAYFDLRLSSEEKHYNTTYLEGGNVLNTKMKDGTPSAVVGEISVGLTLDLMKLEHTPENIEKVKKLIASDLGLKPEQVTFIPQHDFHIDMIYRPLHNGDFAIPDYDTGVKILKKLRADMEDELQEDIKVNSVKYTPIQRKARNLDKQIAALEKFAQETKSTRDEANDILKGAGYRLLNLPCFSASADGQTNFMNGVGGTSAKTGETFYITNKSEYPELQDEITEYLKLAGIDKVYFVSTQSNLRAKGGVDCLTLEK